MSKFYVRTNEGAYLKSHVEFTHYWTKKRDDAEQLTLLEAMKVMDHNKDKLKKGIELFIEAIDYEELEAEIKQDRLLNLLLGEDDTGGEAPDANVDEINHPSHYNQYTFEAIDVIDEVAPKYPVEVAMEIGNAIKYLLRAPFKGRLIQDLNKAVWYINRAIRNLENES